MRRVWWLLSLPGAAACQGAPFVAPSSDASATSQGASLNPMTSGTEGSTTPATDGPGSSEPPAPSMPATLPAEPPTPPTTTQTMVGDAGLPMGGAGGEPTFDAGTGVLPTSDGGGGRAGVGPDAAVTPTCSSFGFDATAFAWPLPDPPIGYPWNNLERTSCSGAGVAYTLLDIDGDELPDLVVYRDCTDTLVGLTRWDVYHNLGNGFQADARPWALPDVPTASPWNALERKTCNVAGATGFAYGLKDIDGDLRPDLIVYLDCADASVGANHWRVYLGGEGGFSETATAWALPPFQTGFPYNALERPSCGATNGTGFAYALRDINGDRKLDIVVFDDCTDAAVGATHWNVYLGESAGFSTAVLAFALPTSAAEFPFNVLDRTSCNTTGGVGYVHGLRDVDGDLAPDLLITKDCADANVGVSHWKLFRNAKTGFDQTATSWLLPPAPANTPWATVERASCNAASATGFTYFLRDMNGDALPDLVSPLDCSDAMVSVTHWNVYEAGSQGFAASPTPWNLPEPTPSATWTTLEKATCSSQGKAYALRDMDGDQRVDLLVHHDCASSVVGLSRWNVHQSACLSR